MPPRRPVGTRCTVHAREPVGDRGRGGSSAGERPGRRGLQCANDRRRPCTRGATRRICAVADATPDAAADDRDRRDRHRDRADRGRGACPRAGQRRVLVVGGRPVDAGPPRLHGPGPLQLHRVAPSLGDRRMGVRDRPGRAVPGLRQCGLQHLRRGSGWPVPGDQRGLRPCTRGPRRPGRCHRPPAGSGHRQHRHARPGARLLPGVASARTARPDQSPVQSALVARPPTAVPGLGQYARLDPARPPRARSGARVVPGPGTLGPPDRRRAPVALTPARSRWPCWGA